MGVKMGIESEVNLNVEVNVTVEIKQYWSSFVSENNSESEVQWNVLFCSCTLIIYITYISFVF